MTNSEQWNNKRIDEIGEIFSGSTPSTTNESLWNGDIVWVTPTDLSHLNSPYLHTSDKKITDAGLKSCSTHLLPAGSIVISSRAPIGYVAIPTVEFCTNQGCKSIRLKPNFDSEFAYYNFNYHIDKLKNVGEGTTFAEISKAALTKIEMPFPESTREQTQIAAILSTIDKAIEQTEAIIAKQQRIKTGLMQDLLTRGIDEQGNIRSEAAHAFKDSPLGRIPVEWEAGGILDFASKTRQAILTGPFGSNLGAEDFVDEGVPILRIGNVQAGYIDQSDLLFVTEAKAQSLSRYVVQAGDLLFARQGATTGRNSLAGMAEEGYLFNYHIIRVAVDPAKCSPTFLYAAFNSESVQNQVNQEKGKGTREGVSTATLTAFVLPIPPFKEQCQIASLLDAQNAFILQEKQALSKLIAQKQGLMQDLLTGKVRVTDLVKKGNSNG